MPWCPKCKAEYREGFTECAYCHVPLTNQKPQDNAPPDGYEAELSLMNPVTVYEAKDGADVAMICEILRNAGIQTATRDSETLGGLLRLYTGSSIYGMSILVDRTQVEKAREILQTWAEQDERAPISEEELTRQALSEMPEEELTREAEAVPPQPLTSNASYEKMKWAVIGVLAVAALFIWIVSK